MPAHGPQILRTAARAVGDRVRLTFTFPISSRGDTWDWGATGSVEQIDTLIGQLQSARDVARVIQNHGEKSAPDSPSR